MVNQLDMTNRVMEHKRRVSAYELAQRRTQPEGNAKPTPTQSTVIAKDLFRLLRQRTLR